MAPMSRFKALSAILGITMAAHAAPAAPAPEAPADLILHGAVVIPIDPPGSKAGAVAIRGDRVIYVGDDAGALALRGGGTRIVDLQGRTLLPGLIDAHGHVSSLGFSLLQIDALGTRSAEEVAAKVREAAGASRRGEWILGRGWDQNDWERKEFPTSRLLDEAAPENPVALSRIDGHALWVSTRALEAAGVTRKTPDPEGGQILRDQVGNPTGILVDNAMLAVRAQIPGATREQTRLAILASLNRCLDSGLTGVHDAGIPTEEADIYRQLAAGGELPIRVYAMLGGNSRTLSNYFETPPIVDLPLPGDLAGGFLTIRAIKLGIDGALGSRGAALLEDYSDARGNRGLITRPPEEIRSITSEAMRKGYQVCVHAIGDRGNRLALDALEGALSAAPAGDYRLRIEHAQVLAASDIPRFKAAGIIPSMQPTHCTSDMPWAQARLGRRRLEGAYAWRRILDTGARIAGGSDFPVESENPFLGLYAAVTRQDEKGRPRGGWRPEERMTMQEALRSFTLDAAYAGFAEGSLGSIAPGKKADLLVLAANPLTAPVSELLTMKPLAVIVAGKVVRSSPDLEGRLPLEAPRAAAGAR